MLASIGIVVGDLTFVKSEGTFIEQNMDSPSDSIHRREWHDDCSCSGDLGYSELGFRCEEGGLGVLLLWRPTGGDINFDNVHVAGFFDDAFFNGSDCAIRPDDGLCCEVLGYYVVIVVMDGVGA